MFRLAVKTLAAALMIAAVGVLLAQAFAISIDDCAIAPDDLKMS